MKLVGWMVTDGPANIREAIEDGMRRILEEPPPAPCGTERMPHLVHPDVMTGKRPGRCGNCGSFVDTRGKRVESRIHNETKGKR